MGLINVKLLISYEFRPAHLLSALGFMSLLVGSVMLALPLIDRLMAQVLGDRPILIVDVLFVMTGLPLVLFGLLADLVVNSRQQAKRRS